MTVRASQPAADADSDAPVLRGEHLLLVPVTAEHVPELRRILHTPEVWQRWGDEDRSPQWPFDDPSAHRFAVQADDAVRGLVQYSEQDDPTYRHAAIDIFLDPTVHGRGLAGTRWRRWPGTCCTTSVTTAW